MSNPVPMVRLPEGRGDRDVLGELSGASGETRPPSVEDLARNSKRAEASHLGSLDVTGKVTRRCWRSCDDQPAREPFRSLR